MNKNYLLKYLSILFVIGLLVLGCDNNLSNNGNEGNTNNENESEGNIVNNHFHLLKGTIWYADNGSLFIEFPDNHLNLILFRNYQYFGNIGGNLNGNVTLGNFRLSSYDGETMKLLDYDNLEVVFTVIISENKMTVNGLNAIKWTAPPFQRRDFRSYNQTYTKGE
jgi:hypothetical protein